MTGTAIPANWRTVRPSALSYAVVRQAKPSTTDQFRLGGRPRVPG
jgi:hypothetical protein